MRRTAAFLLILGILLTGLVPVVTAGHLTWTLSNVDVIITPLASAPGTVEPQVAKKFGSTIYTASNTYTTTNDLLLYKSLDNGVNWDSVGIIASSWDQFGYDFEFVNADTVIACFNDGGTIKFRSSSTGGGLWASPITISTGGVQGVCDVAVFGSAYVVIYSDSVEGDIEVKRSTDGGITFGAEVDILTTDTIDSHATYRNVKLAQKNSTEALLVFIGGASNDAFTSRTTDAGLTWSAVSAVPEAIAAGSDSGVDMVYVSDNRYDLVYYDGTVIFYCTTTTAGQPWSCNSNVATPVTDPTVTIQVNPTDPEQIIIAWSENTAATFLQYTFSSDSGISWDTPATARALGANSVTARVDSLVLPNGDIGIFYHSCKAIDETTDISCNSATADVVTPAVSYATFADVSTALGATATVATTNLQGYDVDPLGGTVVIRDDSANIETYTATTLAASGTFASTCNQLDGVMANRDGNLVGFIDCDGLGDPTHLKIRTSSLQDPTQSDFSGCAVSGTFICNKDIALDGFSEAGGDGSGKLPRIQDFPINYSSSTPVSGLDRRQIAWGYASISGDAAAVGRVGINAYTNVESGDDIRDFAETQYAPTNVEDFCIGLDGSQYYMTAAGSDTTTKVYPVSFTQTPLNPTLGSPTVYASALSQAKGIACGESRVLIQNAGHVWITSRSGTVQKDITGTSATPSNRGLAVSEIFTIGANATPRQFGAYLSDGVISVFDVALCVSLDDCEAVATIEQPTGTWRGMIMDRTAQNLWIFTSTLVSLYTIYTETTIDPVSPQSGSVITPTPTPTTTLLPAQNPDNVLGQAVTSASEAFGFDMAALFGLLVVLAITIKASRASGGAVIVVAIAALIAIVIAVQLGLLDTWVIYATVFLIILAAGGVIFANRRGAGGET